MTDSWEAVELGARGLETNRYPALAYAVRTAYLNPAAPVGDYRRQLAAEIAVLGLTTMPTGPAPDFRHFTGSQAPKRNGGQDA